MQNAGIKALGLDWRYLACEVPPSLLLDALRGAASMRFVGVNLTLPHKLMALDMMDILDESARRWGAVNTVRFEGRGSDGVWKGLGNFTAETVLDVRMRGFNTDADGFVRAIEEDLGMDVTGKRVVLLGAGGAGRVAALRLAAAGVTALYLVNRTEAKAEQIGEEIRQGATPVPVTIGYPSDPVDLVINATSAGLKPDDPLPFDPRQFDLSRASAVYDMIYKPAMTRFLTMAREAGCRVANGTGMLLFQGAAALEIWAERPAPVSVMREALLKHLHPGVA